MKNFAINIKGLYNPESDKLIKRVILEERVNYKGEFMTSYHKGLILDTFDAYIPLSSLGIYNSVAEVPENSGFSLKQSPYEVLFVTDDEGNVCKFTDQSNGKWEIDSISFEFPVLVTGHCRIKIGESFIIRPVEGDKTRIAKVRQILLRDTSATSKEIIKNNIPFSDETIQIGSIFPILEESVN